MKDEEEDLKGEKEKDRPAELKDEEAVAVGGSGAPQQPSSDPQPPTNLQSQ